MAKFENPLAVSGKRTPTYNMTQAQLDEIRQEARREGMRAGTYVANAMYSAALLLTLRDKLGFGRVRLARIFNAVQKLFDEFAADELAHADGAQVLHDECGINLIIERPQGAPVDALTMFRQIEVAKAGYRVKLR